MMKVSTFLPTSSSSTRASLLLLAAASVLLSSQPASVLAADDCLADPVLNAEFPVPGEDSCCQEAVCGLACPVPVSAPAVGYGVAVGFAIGLSFLIGLLTYFLVKGEAENYFVAGKSLPLWIVAMTLGAQSVDSNSLLGNVDLSYKFQFYDGAVIPIGLGLSLILNGVFLAAKINREEGVLTLPDVLSRRYGKVVEVLVGMVSIVSFLMLLAGNLVGMGIICAYVWGINVTLGIWLSAIIVWTYTVTGGLFSVAYTDVVQGAVGWSGCIVCAYWLIANLQSAPAPSIGFPGYPYPDDEISAMYEGVPCSNNTEEGTFCYNAEKYCTDPSDAATCSPIDNGAYPIGDQRIFNGQMGDPQSLTPFPNAIFWNWATIFILGFGNLAALDFQVRCMAAINPRTATLGCLIGGCFTFFIGIPFSYLGAITRYYYGPDSIHAEFTADTCLEILGLPTCAAWVPDPTAFISLLTHQAQPFLGAWCLIGIVAASMSTADGAILAMGTVWSHNITRQLDTFYPSLVTPENLLMAARLSTIPFSLAATIIASEVRQTGYLLIVAFDIMLAGVVAPLFGCFYATKPSPRAALLSLLSGVIVRVVLEFALPKDGFLILPFDYDEFYDYGPAASAKLPSFVDAPADEVWDPSEEPCDSPQLEDYTGVDSLSAFACSIIVFVLIQTIEKYRGYKPLFSFAGLHPYEKDLEKHDDTNRTTKEFDNKDESVSVGEDKDESVSVGEDHADEKAEVQTSDGSDGNKASAAQEYEA